MSFVLYLTYLALLFIRPIEMFMPELAAYRPMAFLSVLTLITSIIYAYRERQIAGRPVLLVLLAMFTCVVFLSKFFNGWSLSLAGGAFGDFSSSATLMLLSAINLNSIARVRKAALLLLFCLVIQAVMSSVAFNYGFMADQLVLRQNTDAEPVVAENYNPQSKDEDVEGIYLWRVRSLGFLNDPNDFGQAMVMAVPFLFLLWRNKSGMTSHLVAIACAASLGYGIYLTQSRGALIGCAAMLLAALHPRLGTWRLLTLLAIGLSAVSGLQFGGRSISTHEESAGQRVDAWWAGIQMLKSRPLLGVGYGNFSDHHVLTAHNSFVLCFAELGMIGYFLWIAMLVVTFIDLNQAISLAPVNSEERNTAILFRLCFTGFIVCAFFLSRTYQPGLYLLLGMCTAITWCSKQKYLSPESESLWANKPWFTRAFLTATLSFLGIYLFVIFS